jgi:hypothetical protein
MQIEPLNKSELEELNQKWFYVKQILISQFTFGILFSIFFIPGSIWMIGFIRMIFPYWSYDPIYVAVFLNLIYILYFTWRFSRSSTLFYYNDWILCWGKIFLSDTLLQDYLWNTIFSSILKFEIRRKDLYQVNAIIRFLIRFLIYGTGLISGIAWMFVFFIMIGMAEQNSDTIDISRHAVILVWLGIFVGFAIYSFTFLYRYFSPYYQFWRVGKRLQTIWKELSDLNKNIQLLFLKDIPWEGFFYQIKKQFSILSGRSREIYSLSVNMEKLEKRINKGNLFDSAKYIGSLRADIVTPLTELKKFLEWQREQLLESQKELSRVRVGWDPETSSEPVLNSFQEWQENIELQSKRSESLLQELDTNITALGEMIGKMG